MRKRLRPQDYVRCVCGKLVERAHAVRGPGDRLFGPECIKKAVQAQR